MEDILLVHRKSNNKAFAHGAVWKTCLRQVLICDENQINDHELLEDDLIFKSDAAYNYLIEVLCGLHSPIVGETEVLGQFRLFVESQKALGDDRFLDCQKWLQFIFTEVRRIRTEHLVGIGSHSYGSLIRRYVKDSESITMIGAGHLAGEILPWLSHKKELRIITRTIAKAFPFKLKIPHLQIHSYDCADSISEVLIIAAPISDELIQKLISSSGVNVKAIFDLRGEANSLHTNVANSIQVVPLHDFFKTLEHRKLELKNKVLEIQGIIQERSLAYINRLELRPLGWDDICA
jgi:glutamyl-tRNA reductase